jgi:hypothetical protein
VWREGGKKRKRRTKLTEQSWSQDAATSLLFVLYSVTEVWEFSLLLQQTGTAGGGGERGETERRKCCWGRLLDTWARYKIAFSYDGAKIAGETRHSLSLSLSHTLSHSLRGGQPLADMAGEAVHFLRRTLDEGKWLNTKRSHNYLFVVVLKGTQRLWLCYGENWTEGARFDTMETHKKLRQLKQQWNASFQNEANNKSRFTVSFFSFEFLNQCNTVSSTQMVPTHLIQSTKNNSKARPSILCYFDCRSV